jgi:arylsulfatase A
MPSKLTIIVRRLFCSFVVLAAFYATADAKGDPPPRPNVVLIFVDDMGYGDLGCYGNSKIKTPNIDKLAAQGQRWTSFYSSGSTCVPSRTGLMSGRHPALLGNQKIPASPKSLLAAMFKRQGYATAILGKWHLAGYPKDFTQSPMHPLECGFDYHFGTPGSNDVPAPVGKKQNRDVFDACHKTTFQVPLIRGREIVEFPVNQELFTKRYTEEAVKWIHARKDERFFLYLAHNMPHAPVFASQAFQGKSDGGRYGDVVEEIDWSVGKVVAALKEAGVDKNTLVVFTSDNGPWSMFGPHGGTAGPLRGEKGTSWEGGFRVPGIFNWPGEIKPSTIDGMAANLDLYATFAALAGGDEPADKPGYISTDMTGTLLREEASPRTQWLFTGGGADAFRSGKYKIHLATKTHSSDPDTRKRVPPVKLDPPLLFDLEGEISEQTNLADSKPDEVARLLAEMKAFLGK